MIWGWGEQSGMERQKMYRERRALAGEEGVIVAERRDQPWKSSSKRALEWKELLAESAGMEKSSRMRTEFVNL